MSEQASQPERKIVLHHLNDSRSQRILWLLEELGIPYEIKKYQRRPDLLAPEELRKIHPLGKSPVITDGDDTIAESGAIIEYLTTKYGQEKFTPRTHSGRMANLYWTHYAEGTLMPLVSNKLLFAVFPQRTPVFIRPIANQIFAKISQQFLGPRLKENGDLIESHLTKQTSGWFAGEDHPTAADFMMIYAMEAFNDRAPECVGPKTKEYLKRVHERPLYKKAVKKGGKYAFADS